ncbi:MAG: hypothetical protein GX620_14540 [Chloroflexi bacterium]|nr:hypothetical protein [Chloroflexota bacterium]
MKLAHKPPYHDLCPVDIWHRTWPFFLLALLCVIFYWDALWMPSDQILGGNDLANMFLHWSEFAASSVRQGSLPLWNPLLFSGSPFVANPQPALFYPPMWLTLLMPVSRALSLVIVLHVWLAGAGTVLWLRSEGMDSVAALFGALTFAFSGYFFVRVRSGHLGVMTTQAWLPLLLWAYKRALDRSSWKTIVAAGLPTGLSILGGHSASLIYVGLALLAYAVFHAWIAWRNRRRPAAAARPLALLAIMTISGLIIAAVQLLPLAELALRSARHAMSDYQFAARFSWPPGYLLTLIIPNFFGEPVRTGYWGDGLYDEVILYIGILPLGLAILGTRMRHRLTPLLIALGLGSLLLAFGQYGILHRLFYQFVPGFSMTRAPARAGFLFTLAASTLAAQAVASLRNGHQESRTNLLAPLNTTLISAVTLATVLLIVAGFAVFALGREANPAAGRLWHLSNQATIFLVFFLLGASLLVGVRRGAIGSAQFGVAAVALVIFDLWTFGSGIVKTEPVQENAYWRIVAQTVPERELSRILPWGLNDFDQNGGMAYGLSSVFGYDPLILHRYQQFIASIPDHGARTYDLLNAGYLVTTAAQSFDDAPNAPELIADNSGVWIYRRPSAMPRAWFVSELQTVSEEAVLTQIAEDTFDPTTTALIETAVSCPKVQGEPGRVEITEYANNRIAAQTSGGGGLLVFSEIDYPGWYAAINGVPVPIIRADYLLRAVCVPEGTHQVVLTYDPLSLKIGGAVTILGLISLAAISWAPKRSPRSPA